MSLLKEFNTNITYYVKGLPTHLIVPELIMRGCIGKKERNLALGVVSNRGNLSTKREKIP